jgi:hypothetical protein
VTSLFFLGLADIAIMILWGPMTLALYFALKQTNKTWSLLATISVFLLASIPFAGYTTAGPTTAVQSAIIAVTYLSGGLLSLAWYILVGLRLLKLSHSLG